MFQTCDGKSVLVAIKGLKNSMQGINNISIQLLKHLQEKHCNLLAEQFNKWMSGDPIDESFKRGILLPLPKVSSPTLLKHYRPIVVLPTIYRLYSTIINNQLMDTCDDFKLVHECQCGFKRKGSTLDQLIVLKSVVHYHISRKLPIFITITDIKNAYGSVIHSKLCLLLKQYGFNDQVTKVV
ncbi:hypothetical protein ABK040_016362 [Willaertia magna]